MKLKVYVVTIVLSIFALTAVGTAGDEPRAKTGTEVELEGVILSTTNNEMKIRTHQGEDMKVLLSEKTKIEEKKSNPFRSAEKYSREDLLVGLNIRLEGTMDSSGAVRAEEVKFTQDELKVAKTITSRVNPIEEKLSATEQRLTQTAEELERNTSQLSGEVEELGEAYRVARGEAAGAQKTADEAKAGVESTQNRISALDSFTEVKLETVNFGFDSSELSDDARRQLDEFVTQVEGNKGFLIEVVGFASPEGNEAYNRRLSQKRADAVVSYLVEEHNVPLRRILRPYGFGEKRLISEEPGRDARAQNRRVEIRLLKSEGYVEDSQQTASIG